MAITKSYNKQTGIYYAYETTYEWSDAAQKKVQKKRCIGKIDPQTGEVIPNGKVGRPLGSKSLNKPGKSELSDQVFISAAEQLVSKASNIEVGIAALSRELKNLNMEISKLVSLASEQGNM